MTLKSILKSLAITSIILTSSLADDNNSTNLTKDKKLTEDKNVINDKKLTNSIKDRKSSISSLTPSANMAITSNYIWRGASLSNNTLVFQSGFDLEHSSGLYIGTWGSEITDGTEMDLYLGYTTKISNLDIDIGFIDFGTITLSKHNVDFSKNAEAYLALGYSIVGIDFGVTESYDILAKTNNIEATIAYDASIVNFSIAAGYNENVYSQLHIGIPFAITTGEFGIDAGYTSEDIVVGISHSISF